MMQLLRARRSYEMAKRRFDHPGRGLETAYGELSARYFRKFWEQAARAGSAVVEEVSGTVLRIRKGNRWTFVRRHQVMLDSFLSHDLVNDKALIHEIAAGHGWRAPRHLAFDYLEIGKAAQFMERINSSVVVKPAAASRGNGITTDISSPDDLRRASLWASTYDRRLIVEEYIRGDNYRLLFLDGECIAAVRREPPAITGDGRHTVRELVRLENTARLAGRPITSLIPLTLDLECRHTLRKCGLGEHSVPGRNVRVKLKSVINQNASRQNHTFTERIHPSILETGHKIGTVLNLKLFGMDVITGDIGAPLAERGGVITEINTGPGLHYHDLVSDESGKIPVGEIVLEAIFARTDQRWCSQEHDDTT